MSKDRADDRASSGESSSDVGRRAAPGRRVSLNEPAMLCERCQSEMFRMHAVWRCPNCGYKTDCCGW